MKFSELDIHQRSNKLDFLIFQQSLQYIDKALGSQFVLDRHEPHLSFFADDGYQIKAMSGSGCSNDRCFTIGRPNGSTLIIRLNTGFVTEIDGRTVFLGFSVRAIAL